MSEPKEVFMPLIELPSGVSIRPDRINFIARQELNKYVAHMQQAVQMPFLTGEDLDVLRGLGVVQKPAPVPEAATAAPALEVAKA